MNINYDRNFYGFDKNFLQDVNRIENKKAFLTISLTWLSIFLIELIATHFVGSTYFWLFYIPLIFIIAGRQGVLLQLVHEGAHTLLNSNKNINDFLSNYFCALPLGLTHQGYKVGHYEHHLHTGTQLDPPSDREKYKFTDMTKGDMYLLFLKDLSGISALSVFFCIWE